MQKTVTPIREAVEPLKVDAQRRAVKDALAVARRVARDLAEAGNDLEACAPYPNSRTMGGNAYKLAQSRRNLFSSLTRTRPNQRLTMRGPHLADIDFARVMRFVRLSREQAAAQYEAFVAKLETKVGAHEGATLAGNHVWGHSILTVEKAGGEVERWKTQQIVNFSKLGTPFNQWPSRKVK